MNWLCVLSGTILSIIFGVAIIGIHCRRGAALPTEAEIGTCEAATEETPKTGKGEAVSNALQDRLDLMIDVVIARNNDTVLTEAIDGLHKGQFILWAADGSRVIRVGTKDFALHGASLSMPSPRQG